MPITVDAALAPHPPTQLVEDPGSPYLVVDLYQHDEGPHPPWSVLVAQDHPVVIGAILKASQGVGYVDHGWFADNLRAAKAAGGGRAGTSWFVGAYHYLEFLRDPKRQAEDFCNRVHAAGDFDQATMMPFVDIEWGGERASNRKASTAQIIECASTFAHEVTRLTGRLVGLYGRSVMRDRQITSKLGCSAVWNPAYTPAMETNGLCSRDPDGSPNRGQGAWQLDDILLWQYCGDGDELVAKLPGTIAGFGDGKVDISVVIDGAHRPTLARFIERAIR